MADNSANFTGDVPDHYDAELGPIFFEHYATDLAQRAAQFAPTRVLELAAGTGRLTNHLLGILPPGGHLVATDLNAPMLAFTRDRLGARADMVPVIADATALPFLDKSFDLVACQFGVMFFPDRVASYKEARRVLRPGGHYLLNAWGTLVDNPCAQIADELAETSFPDDPPAFYKVPWSYGDPDVAVSELEAAGFSECSVAELPIEQPVPDWAVFSRGFVYGNPMHQALLDRDADPETFRSGLQRALEEKFAKSPASVPLRAYAVTAKA